MVKNMVQNSAGRRRRQPPRNNVTVVQSGEKSKSDKSKSDFTNVPNTTSHEYTSLIVTGLPTPDNSVSNSSGSAGGSGTTNYYAETLREDPRGRHRDVVIIQHWDGSPPWDGESSGRYRLDALVARTGNPAGQEPSRDTAASPELEEDPGNTTSSSRDFDPEMLCLPPTPEEDRSPLPVTDSRLSRAIATAASRLYIEYREQVIGESAPQDDGGDQNTSGGSASSSRPSGTQYHGGFSPAFNKSFGKRLLDERDEAGERPGGEGGGTSPPGKKSRREHDKLLACHFWKHDPVGHRDCFKSQLRTVSRVKQHLLRRHTPDFYCERCKAIFSDQNKHQDHLAQNCTFDPSTTLDGITQFQHRRLSRRSKPSLSESEQWFAIWDILFPGQTRPSSAYMDPGLSEDICQFRHFFQRRGPEILEQELRNAGRVVDGPSSGGGGIQTDSLALRHVLEHSLDMIFQHWFFERTGTLLPGSASREPELMEGLVGRQPAARFLTGLITEAISTQTTTTRQEEVETLVPELAGELESTGADIMEYGDEQFPALSFDLAMGQGLLDWETVDS